MGVQGTSMNPTDMDWLVNHIRNTQNQPVTPTPTGSTTKTATQYVPYISATPSPNGGNTTEYRAPRPGDTGIGVTVPTPTPTPTPAPTVNTPTQSSGLYQDPYARSREEIAQLARDRVQKILQAGRTAAGGARTGAKNAYDYTNQIEGDSRTLRNAQFAENNGPFSGKYQYDKTNMLRNDTIQDTAQDKDYNAQVGLINQKLADLEAAAPGDEQAIIDQLEQIERQTGISVAQLQEQQKNNQFNQGMQNRQFDQNQQVIDYNQNPNNPNNYGQTLTNQLNELKIGNYSTEVKQQAALFEQEYKKGNLTNEALEYNLKQAKDPNSPTNLAAKLDLQMKQIDAASYSQENKLKLQQLQKQIADIGVVHKQPQTANEIEMDKVKLQTAQEQLKQLQNTSNTPKIDPKESTDNLTFYQSQIDLRPNLTKEQKLSYAQGQKSGLSDSDYNKLVAYIKDNS